MDSVNAVAWQPFTNNLCTGSGDKTVSLWDARSGLCMQVRENREQSYVWIDVQVHSGRLSSQHYFSELRGRPS